MQITEMAIVSITVNSNRRPVKPAVVKALVESIREIGLQHPIGVTKDGRLIHGRHRLEAYREMQKTTIPVIVHDIDDLHARLAEIDENIQRHNLTALEEGQALKDRKEIYLALHPQTKQGTAGGTTGGRGREKIASDKMSFANDTATKTGKSARTIERSVEVADKLTPATQTQIAGTKVADSKAELKKLADLPPKQQEKVAGIIGSGKAQTVTKAMEMAGAKPPKADKPKAAEPVEISDAEKARFTVGNWVKTLDAFLQTSPTVDEYRKLYPSKHGDTAVRCISDARKALADWKKVIK